MKRCYLLHGIKTVNPWHSSIAFFQHIMPRFQVIVLSYMYIPVVLAVVVPVINHFVIKRLVKQVHPGHVIIGHSNGATIAYRLSKEVYVKGLVLINPALNSNVEFDKRLGFVHVYWSKKDWVVWVSRLMPFSLWGSMGRTGYTGEDARVRQFEMGEKHTSIGDAEVAVRWGPVIVRNIEEALKTPA